MPRWAARKPPVVRHFAGCKARAGPGWLLQLASRSGCRHTIRPFFYFFSTMTDIALQPVSGDAILPWLDALASLRIQVFREWPYLYDGSEDYERDYLRRYAASSQSLVVLALHAGSVVGAASGLPLSDADDAFQAPFLAQGVAPETIFYFGESVLERRYRGRGLGHRFFDEREAFAAGLGYAVTAFCAVQRPADHPRRPVDYRALDTLWLARGYQRQPQLTTYFPWQDIGDDNETSKPMMFWTRGL